MVALNNLFESLIQLVGEMEKDAIQLEEFCENNNLELNEEVEMQRSFLLSVTHILKDNKNSFGISMEEMDRKFKEKISDSDALEIFLEKE